MASCESYIGLLETEGLGNSIRASNRPPTKSDEESAANVLHHVKIHCIQQNNHHRLNIGITEEETAEKIEKDSQHLQLNEQSVILP